MDDLVGLFKQQFTFSVALTAAQKCVTPQPEEAIPYILAAAASVALLKAASTSTASGPGAELAAQATRVATQILSSLLGTWITAMVGPSARVDQLFAAAGLGLIMMWIASRSLSAKKAEA